MRDSVYFLSDLHLGASYLDKRGSERRIVAFLDSIRERAQEIYLLGDVLDYWYEYRYVVPRGFVRFFGKLAELADSGVKITWLIGNHDIWIFDYLPTELGIEVVDGSLTRTIQGRRFHLSHGDGVGHQPATFRFIRALFRNPVAQRLYSGIHPRWTIPFAHAWSGSSRKNMPADGDLERSIEALREYSAQRLQKDPAIDYFVYGHLHLLFEERLSDGASMIVIGDWIDKFSYLLLREGQISIERYEEYV